MTSQTVSAPPPHLIDSTSSSPSPSEGIIDTSSYKPQLPYDIILGLLTHIDTILADPSDDNLNSQQLEYLRNQTYAFAIPAISHEPSPSTDPVAVNADPAAPGSTPIAQDVETISLPSSYFNLATTTFTTGLVGIALRNILRMPNPVTASFKPASITGVPNYARPQITPPLSQLLNLSLQLLRPTLVNSPTLEALDRIEVDTRLQELKETGQPYIAPRLRDLQEVDEDDEDDDPLNAQAILGFLDFVQNVFAQEADLGLATAQGWLCAQWKYSDGRILVLWFKNRTDSMLTALDSQGQILQHIGADPKADTLQSISQLLVQEGFFSWSLK